jgi:ectoine hydroxylase-related dioxygenase (phytanoyl-CoA dioxygenase family)
MAVSESQKLTSDDIATFQEDGALCVRNVFNDNEVEALRDAVEIAMADPGPYAMEFNDPDGAKFIGEVFVSNRIPVVRDILVNSSLGEIAGKLMGSQTVRFFFDHLLVKEAGSTLPTPWHQDAPYFPMNGFDCCGIWIALDHVNAENGAVEYLKGTHKGDTLYAPRSFAKGHSYVDQLTQVPDIDANRSDYDIATWECEVVSLPD